MHAMFFTCVVSVVLLLFMLYVGIQKIIQYTAQLKGKTRSSTSNQQHVTHSQQVTELFGNLGGFSTQQTKLAIKI